MVDMATCLDRDNGGHGGHAYAEHEHVRILLVERNLPQDMHMYVLIVPFISVDRKKEAFL